MRIFFLGIICATVTALSPALADEQPAHWVRVQQISPGQWSVTGGDGVVLVQGNHFHADLKIDPRRSRNPETGVVEGPGLILDGNMKGHEASASLIHAGVQTIPSQVKGSYERTVVSEPNEPGLMVSPVSAKLQFSTPNEFITIEFSPVFIDKQGGA